MRDMKVFITPLQTFTVCTFELYTVQVCNGVTLHVSRFILHVSLNLHDNHSYVIKLFVTACIASNFI